MKFAALIVLFFSLALPVLHATEKDSCIYWRLNDPDSTQTYSDSLANAAQSGYADAQLALAICYDNGDGVAADPALAVHWYQASAQQGNGYAQANLGGCFAEGYGIAKDIKQALKWYNLSADQGCAMGQFNLGLAYETGMGVHKDLQEAKRLYLLAAAQGDANALCSLGDFYQFGIGVKPDMIEAYFWYLLADQFGSDKAWGEFMHLQSDLTDEEIYDTEIRADKWLQEH